MTFTRIISGWRLENVLGNLLRIGVFLSGLVVLGGGALYLVRHGREPFVYEIFRGEPSNLRSIEGIIDSVKSVSARGIIQLGLLMLIATPVARVAFSVGGFALEKDWKYVVMTLVVLTVLVYSILSGGV
jgi:uncharacterized membrane protein